MSPTVDPAGSARPVRCSDAGGTAPPWWGLGAQDARLAHPMAAAAALFRERGVAGVSMDEVATAPGGQGALFRRFGDKAGLASALLDAQERALQEAILFGPAPP